MNYSRGSLFLWGGFIGMAAFVMGRTTAPVGVSASAHDQFAGSEENNRQIAIAVKKEFEESMKNRMPKLIEEGIAGEWARAAKESRMISLQSVLQMVRSQLELYRIQHVDRYPTFSDMRDWLAFTSKTDSEGHISERGENGPYIVSPVSNPLTGHNKIVASGQATRAAGWTYDEKTGEIRAVIPRSALDATGPAYEKSRGDFEFAPEN